MIGFFFRAFGVPRRRAWCFFCVCVCGIFFRWCGVLVFWCSGTGCRPTRAGARRDRDATGRVCAACHTSRAVSRE